MARGVNKVILIGNLGADPDTRYSASGSPVCTLSLATTESWLDKQSGQRQERTEWHRVKVFGKLAEICQEYLHKGRQVYIEGSLRTSKYTGKDGLERYSTDIVARDMQMLSSGGGGEGRMDARPQQARGGQPAQRGPRGQDPARAPAPQAAEPDAGYGGDDLDDDIPF